MRWSSSFQMPIFCLTKTEKIVNTTKSHVVEKINKRKTLKKCQSIPLLAIILLFIYFLTHTSHTMRHYLSQRILKGKNGRMIYLQSTYCILFSVQCHSYLEVAKGSILTCFVNIQKLREQFLPVNRMRGFIVRQNWFWIQPKPKRRCMSFFNCLPVVFCHLKSHLVMLHSV